MTVRLLHNSFEAEKYPLVSVLDTREKSCLIKQREDQNLCAYLKELEAMTVTLENFDHKDYGIAEGNPILSPIKPLFMKRGGHKNDGMGVKMLVKQQLLAIAFICGANKRGYEGVWKDLLYQAFALPIEYNSK